MKGYIQSLKKCGMYFDRVEAVVIIPKPFKEDYEDKEEWLKDLKEWNNLRLGKVEVRLENAGENTTKAGESNQ